MAVAVEAAAAGKRVLWGAPVYDQVRIAWDETQYAAAALAVFNQGTMTAAFPRQHGAIIFRSLDDPDNARGHTADGVIIDECSSVKAEAWQEVLRPMLIDTNGWAWGLGTPRGRNWFWREWLAAHAYPDAAAWQIPTVGVTFTAEGIAYAPHPLENPDIPFREIEQLYQTLSEPVFRQEILAEFLEAEGLVFRHILEAATVAPLTAAVPGQHYIIGCDWGRTTDATAFAVVDVRNRSCVALDRMTRIDYALQVGRLQALAAAFQPTAILAEQNSMGGPLVEHLQRLHLPVQGFTTTNASKAEIIQALALAFERQQIRILADPHLIAELQAFEVAGLPSGLPRYQAAEGFHDDTVIALALAWWGAQTTAPIVAPDFADFRRPSPWKIR